MIGSAAIMLVVLPLAGHVQIHAKQWFIVPLLWLALAVPATVGVYGHCFREEWAGADRSVPPAEYLWGLTSIWAVLAAGVGLSLAACLLAGAASPGIWPGALMLMLLVLARPTTAIKQADRSPLR
ncbi:MAG: hypothetical protein AAF333_11265 [Planctomycetota bacterium]